jgi:hypothetical protein
MRRRGAVTQPWLSLGAVAAHPLAGAADADAGGLGRLRHRPLALNHSQTELTTAFRLSAALACRFIRCPPWWD